MVYKYFLSVYNRARVGRVDLNTIRKHLKTIEINLFTCLTLCGIMYAYAEIIGIYVVAPTPSQTAKMRTAQVIAKMKEKGYDALDELIDMAKDARRNDDLETRLEIAKTLMPYVYPKLKHVEVDAQVNHGLTVHVRQFIKPERVNTDDGSIQPITNPNSRSIEGTGVQAAIPVRSSALTTRQEISGEELVRAAGLPVSAGGHPDIIPDPELPEKRQKMSPW